MLILDRKVKQRILIGNDIVITVIHIGKGQVKLGIDADKDTIIDREEVRERREKNWRD